MKKILTVLSMLFAFASALGMQTSHPVSNQGWKNPLIEAVKLNDISEVKRIINNVWDNKGQTVMKFLLAYKHKEAWSKNEMQEYLDQQDQRVKDIIDYSDDSGNTPLITAIWSNNIELVKYLVDRGANVDLQDYEGDTPLIMAVWSDHWAELVPYLIDKGADKNKTDRHGSTPLIIAVEIRNKTLVKYLVEHGADIDTQDEYQDTALLIAVKKDYFELVKYLVDHNANINKATNSGNTPLWTAVKNGHVAIVKYLLDHGADVNMAVENLGKYLTRHGSSLDEDDDIESILLLISEYIRYKHVMEIMNTIRNIAI